MLQNKKRQRKLKPSIESSLGHLKPYLLGLLLFAVVVVFAFGFDTKMDISRTKTSVVDYSQGYAERESEIREMVKGYPIEQMVPWIARKDKIVAAYMVSIAKKESNWGKRVPVLNGKDCYNYWGYRGKRQKMGTGGHTCFDSPKDAVDTVARRIRKLVYEKNLTSPDQMIIWKCGSSCYGHDKRSVTKWIADVSLYYNKLINN